MRCVRVACALDARIRREAIDRSSSAFRLAGKLREVSLGTLLIDLLTQREKVVDRRTGRIRFDIERLAARVVRAAGWLLGQIQTQDLNVGLLGSSTGAAAALVAAAERPEVGKAVVSRSGRVDMAEAVLHQVKAPTLFLVGAQDQQVRGLNRQAFSQLETEKQPVVVPGAGHPLEEPRARDETSWLAGTWFQGHLTS